MMRYSDQYIAQHKSNDWGDQPHKKELSDFSFLENIFWAEFGNPYAKNCRYIQLDQ